MAHLREIIAELEEGEFKNIPEVLRIPATEHVECAVGTMIALQAQQGRGPLSRVLHENLLQKEKQFVLQKKSVKAFHEELKEDGFNPRFLVKVRLLRNRSEQPLL